MKSNLLLSALFVVGALALGGCGHLDLSTPEGDPDRVLTGTVNYSLPDPLPAGAVLTVRVLDTSNPTVGPLVVGEQKIENPGASPIAFKVDYRAEEPLLRRGLNIDAHISVGGALRFANQVSYAVNVGNAQEPHEIWVGQVSR